MLKILSTLILAVGVGLIVGTLVGNYKPADCLASWEGSTDQSMLEEVQEDIKQALDTKCEKLIASLFSVGGPTSTSIEIAQVLRRARDEGLILEIHGRSMVASGGVLVLAAGSPGHRYIAHNSFVLIHGIQYGRGYYGGGECYDGTEVEGDPEFEYGLERTLDQMVNEMVLAGVAKKAAYEAWTSCEGEYTGGGEMLVDLGVADWVEG